MNKSLAVTRLTFLLAFIAVVGYGAAAFTSIAALSDQKAHEREICATSGCVKNFVEFIEEPLQIAKATSDFLVAIATTGGVIVALMSYVSSASNSALSNHLMHYTTFQSYVTNEISKRNRISPSSVDIFLWYNLIFPESKDGNIRAGTEYRNFLTRLNFEIQASNDQILQRTDESFRYKPHQVRIITTLADIGIEISQQPRVGYFEIEDQIISLITCVNQAFCGTNQMVTFDERKYF